MIHRLTEISQSSIEKIDFPAVRCITSHPQYENCESSDLYSTSLSSIQMPLAATKCLTIVHRNHSSSFERSMGSSHILFFGFGGPSSAVLPLKVVPWASGSAFSAGFWLSSAICPTFSDKLFSPSRTGCPGCCIFAPWPPPPALIDGAT